MKIRPEAGSFGFIIILAAVSALGPFSIDMYLPALPDMSRALGASPAVMQMTITAFLAGIAIGPLFLAPLSDAWGRKKTQLVFLLLFSLASAACMLAESGEALVALRAVQAIVAGAAMTSARAMLSDIFEGDALSRATSILMAFFTMAPVIAPMVGASLLEIFDWRGIFGALVALGVVSALLMQILPNTSPRAPQPLCAACCHCRLCRHYEGYPGAALSRLNLLFCLHVFRHARRQPVYLYRALRHEPGRVQRRICLDLRRFADRQFRECAAGFPAWL